MFLLKIHLSVITVNRYHVKLTVENYYIWPHKINPELLVSSFFKIEARLFSLVENYGYLLFSGHACFGNKA